MFANEPGREHSGELRAPSPRRGTGRGHHLAAPSRRIGRPEERHPGAEALADVMSEWVTA
ncbi:hypothetical protein ACWEO2_07725 [Nocardia sp. NPDC004278]